MVDTAPSESSNITFLPLPIGEQQQQSSDPSLLPTSAPGGGSPTIAFYSPSNPDSYGGLSTKLIYSIVDISKMKTLIKSPLKNAANNIVKIGSTPNARKIKSLDFDRPRENETFIKWIESSSKIFESVDLPNKRELKKLADFDVIGGGGGLAGLLAALGGLGISLTGRFSWFTKVTKIWQV